MAVDWRHPNLWTAAAGVLLIAAGIRDRLIPGFLTLRDIQPAPLDSYCMAAAGLLLLLVSFGGRTGSSVHK